AVNGRAREIKGGATANGGRSAFDEPDDQQQDHRPDHGIDDRASHAADVENADQWQEPTGEQGADNADDDVPDQPITVTLDDQAGEPAGNPAYNQPNNQIDEHGVLHIVAGGPPRPNVPTK